MYLRYQLAKALQDERLRTAAREQRAAEARRARTACPDHAAATKARATARAAAKMPGKQGAITGPGIPPEREESCDNSDRRRFSNKTNPVSEFLLSKKKYA